MAKQPAERSSLRCVWCHIKAFESSGAELATHRKAHFNTCSSSGVNLGLADIHLPSPGPMQAQAAFCFSWFRSVLSYIHLHDLRSDWELRDVNQRQTMHQEGARTNPRTKPCATWFITFDASPTGPDQRSPFQPQPLSAQHPRLSSDQWLPRLLRVVWDRETTYPQAAFVATRSPTSTTALVLTPFHRRPESSPLRTGRDRALAPLVLPSAHGGEEARASSSLLTAQPYLAKALRERERGKQSRRLLHVNHAS